MSIPITIAVGDLAANYCFTTAQQYMDDMFAAVSMTVPGGVSNVIISATTPDPVTYQDYLWVKIDSGGAFERCYTYSGSWKSMHPVPASGDERRLWVGADNAGGLWSYDGGDGTDPAAATDSTGGMWMVDTTFAFKMPIGVGANAVAYNGGNTAVAVGGTGGEEQHILTTPEIPSHTHDFNLHPSGTGIQNGVEVATDCGDNTKTTDPTGGGLSHQNMPPYIGVYFVKRSVRKYITA